MAPRRCDRNTSELPQCGQGRCTTPPLGSLTICGRSGYDRAAEPGKCGGSRDDHAVSGKMGATPVINTYARLDPGGT